MMGKSGTSKFSVGRVIGGITVILATVFWVVPGLGLLITSFRPIDESSTSGWWTVFTRPGQLTVQNYVEVIGNDSSLLKSLWWSLAISAPATFLVVAFGALAAYALAWTRFPGRQQLLIVIIGLLVVPLQMALVPSLRIFNTLGVKGIPSAWLFHAAFGLPFAVFLLRNFMVKLPASLLEAARMDGASELVIFRKIVLPLSWPAIASLSIFQFTWVWNDLLVALVFAGEDKPFTVFLQNQLGAFSSGLDVISTGVFISGLIPLGIFLAFQKHFESGLLGGAVK